MSLIESIDSSASSKSFLISSTSSFGSDWYMSKIDWSRFDYSGSLSRLGEARPIEWIELSGEPLFESRSMTDAPSDRSCKERALLMVDWFAAARIMVEKIGLSKPLFRLIDALGS